MRQKIFKRWNFWQKIAVSIQWTALMIFCVEVTAFAAAKTLDFANARTMMRERSDILAASASRTEAARQTTDSLKTLWGPTISAQAVELWGESHIDIDRKITTPLGSMPVDINEYKNFSGPRASVTGTWPLFTGGKIRAEQNAAKFDLAESEAEERGAGIEQDIKLIGHYFGLQLAIAIEKVRKEMLAQQEKEVARARQFERKGMISKVERMGVDVSRDKSEREWLKARGNTRIARIQLGHLLRNENFGALATPLFVLKNGLEPAKKWIDETVANNPQIAMLEAQVKKAEAGVEAARGNFSPDIFAFGQYSFIRHYQTMIEPTWLAGIGINFTLWDARGRIGRYKSAKAVSREARAMRADIVNQARTDAEVAWQNTRNAMERYQLTAGNVALARENLDLKTQGFEEGLNTALEMTDARNELAEAQVSRKVAAYEFVVNFAILHAIAGQMDNFIKMTARKDLAIED